MRKTYLLGLAAALLLLASCNNEPTAPTADSIYLPKLAEKVIGSSENEAKEIMEGEAFKLEKAEQGSYGYSKSFTDKRKNTGNWILSFEVYDNKVENAEAAQEILDMSTIATTATAWGNYIKEQQPNLSLWVGIIKKNGQVTYYLEGSMVDPMRTVIETVLNRGVSDATLKSHLEELQQMLSRKRTDYLTDLKAVDFSVNGTGCTETYVTINSVSQMTGQVRSYSQGSLRDSDIDFEDDANNMLVYHSADGEVDEYLSDEVAELFDMINDFGY